MYRYLIGFFIVFGSFLLTAQSSIRGEISDQEGTPLSYANVILYSLPDSLFARGAVCNAEGQFTLGLDSNRTAYFEVSAVGFETTTVEIVQGQERYTLRLSSNAQLLDEIKVSARRTLFRQEADRLVINPGSQVTAAGGNALDFLEKSPGVTVNRISNSLQLNGKTGVLVMINGKVRRLPADALLSLLQGISLNDVEAVELITNPPAEYEAAGNGGIIHIITRSREAEGMSGNLGIGLNYRERLGGQANASVQWNTRRLRGFATYSSVYTRPRVDWSEELLIPLSNGNTGALSQIDRLEKEIVHNLSLGLAYAPNDQTTAELLVNGYYRDFSQRGTSRGTFQQPSMPEQSFRANLYEENVRSIRTIYGGIAHRMGENHRISSSLEHIYANQDQPSNYRYTNESSEDSEIDVSKGTPLSTWIAKLDYSWQLGPDKSLGLGTKFNASSFDNRVAVLNTVGGTTTMDESLSNRSELEESILGVYASGRWQIHKKWSLRAGLRAERTRTELLENEALTVVDRDYTNWFFNLTSEYEINERSRISFSYGDRISRPSFNDLAPFVFYSNPVTVFYGNPSLFPSRSRTVGTKYSRGSFSVGLDYNSITDQMSPFFPQYEQEQELLFRYTQNLDNVHRFQLQVSFPVQPTPWLEYQNTLILEHSQIMPDKEGPSLSNPGFTYQGNCTVTLPNGFSLGASGNFFYRTNWGVFYLAPSGHLDLGVTKKFAGSNATLGFTFVDAFNTYQWDILPIEGFLPDLDIRTVYRPGMQGVRLTYSMPFGSKQIKKKNIDTGSAEDKARIN